MTVSLSLLDLVCPADDVDLSELAHLSDWDRKWISEIACPEFHMTIEAARRLRRREQYKRANRAIATAMRVRDRMARRINDEPEPPPKYPDLDLWAPLT